MRDEGSLRRLAEIGVDVYLPRGAWSRDAVEASEATARRTGVVAPAAAGPEGGDPGNVVVLAGAGSKAAQRLLGDVMRALRFARVACAQVDVAAGSVLAGATALVVFGAPQARAAGAALPAQRRAAIDWVVSAEPSALRGDAVAKRALWSELRRMMRGLASRGGPARR